jgi:hypothetical protein
LDNITSGIITVQNISKFWDYAIPAALFMLAGVLHHIFFIKDTSASDSDSRLLKGLPLGFASAYIVYVVGACANISETALSIAALSFVAILTYVVVKKKFEVPNVVQLCIALCALNLKIFTTQGTLLVLVLLNAAALLLVFKQKRELLLAIVSIIIFKKFDFGPYIVNDLFHSSEFVVSYQRGLNMLGEWQVFPNIGYLEEAIPNFIVDAFSRSTGGYLQISIQDAYSLCLIFLTGSMYYFLEKKWKGVAYALTMLMAVERLTLMLVINMGLLLSTLRSTPLTWTVIGFAPLLMLGLSPSYGAIFVLSLALFFLKNKPELKLLWPTALIACACLLWYGDTFVYFLKVYKDWGAVNSAAHGTAMWAAPTFKTVLRLAFVFLFSFFVWQVIHGEVFDVYSGLAIFGIAVSLWMYLNYGFTRLDKDTGSRIFPVGLAIFVSVIPYLKRYTQVAPALLFVSFFGASFATPQPIGEIDLFRQSPKMTMDAENQEILDRYSSVAQKLGGEVILFGSQPTLGNYIPNAHIPPFSSPWVAIGQLPQERVIAFLQAHSELPVMLGDNFSTWDHVDVRARSPLIYRYMAQHYKQVVIHDVIVAIPSTGYNKSILFSDFNIGAAASYYEKSKALEPVMVPCENGDAKEELYKVVNQHNYFYALLRCGLNTVPQVYVSGMHLRVSKRQVP